MHGQQHRIRVEDGLTRCAGSSSSLRFSSESLQLSFTVCIAEDDVMSCPRKIVPSLPPLNPEPRMPMRMVGASSRCLVNNPHLLLIHSATVHGDFRDSRFDITKICRR